ncbi:MAG TPA: 50S ribosomal protein L10 [Myxococcaceae bacterium]|nr:50S ribosomal protein L10 [Myxococcaceae bacterium]
MERSEKEVLIRELNEKFSRARTAIVAEFSRLNVETVTRLRKKFREVGVDYKVLKNTLARRAAEGTPVAVVSDDFKGPVAIAIGYDDAVAPAKVLSEFIKDLEVIRIRSAVVEGRRTDAAGVAALAKLPGLRELRAKLLGLLEQPAGKLVRTVAEPGSRLARLVQARGEALGK